MRHICLAALAGSMLVTGCNMRNQADDARAEIAPTGTVRVALNFGNQVLATRTTPDGEPGGVAAELGRELGRRLERPVRFLSYESAAAMADDARTGKWDVAFLAADPAREDAIAFTPPYLELDATYLVPTGSRFLALEEVDVEGVRVAARPRSAYDLFLRRSLKHATLVYPEGVESDLDLLAGGRADVLAGLRHALVETAAARPEFRVLDGRFAAMQQAIGAARGRPAAAAYLKDFVEDVKASGVVAKAIAARGAEGVSVAAAAQ